jgi:xylan 1,4-beta-xylosidase
VLQVRDSRAQVADHPFYLTEYNVGCCLGYQSHDNSAAAAFVFRTVGDLNDALDLYSYWTFTDVFEEGGLAQEEFKNVYGMMTVHGIPKPVWRAFQLLHEHAGDTRLPTAVGAQTAGGNRSYVAAFATTGGPSKGLRVFLSCWGNPDPAHPTGDRSVTVVLRHSAGEAPAAQATLHVVNQQVGVDPRGAWLKMGSPAKPSAAQMAVLKKASETRSFPATIAPINDTASSVTVLMPQDTAAVLEVA